MVEFRRSERLAALAKKEIGEQRLDLAQDKIFAFGPALGPDDDAGDRGRAIGFRQERSAGTSFSYANPVARQRSSSGASKAPMPHATGIGTIKVRRPRQGCKGVRMRLVVLATNGLETVARPYYACVALRKRREGA